MLKKIFCAISAISFAFALAMEKMDTLASAIIDGASKAVSLSISLLGLTALWCGIMEVYSKCGACRLLAKLISPLMKLLFPEACKSGIGTEEIAQLPDKSQLILVYCRSGNRSKTASSTLADLGYTNIYEFGGINTWPYDTEP